MPTKILHDIDDSTPRQLLKRAYVSMNCGYFEEAIEACVVAAERADDPLVADTLRGAILTASGRPTEALQLLMPLHRQREDAILTALYLAEACFFAGRIRRGWKVLDGIDPEELDDSPWRDFADQLRRSWEQRSDDDQLVQPLRIPIGAPSPQANHEQ